MEEEFIDVVEEKPKPIIEEHFKKVFRTSVSACKGCGSVLALKMCLQLIENPIIVFSKGCMSLLTKYPNTLDFKIFNAIPNPAAAATSLSRIFKDNNVVCFAGDGSTKENLQSLLFAAEKKENFIYICYNNQGFCNIGKSSDNLLPLFAETVGMKAIYSATACISDYEDFSEKIKKAVSLKGVKFIEVLCPCPAVWKYDPSNTIEVAKLAVETGVWPLYEIENKKLSFTIPTRLESLERFLETQGRFSTLSEEDKQNIKKNLEENLKSLSKRK